MNTRRAVNGLLLVCALLAGCALHEQPRQSNSNRWPFFVQGELGDADIAAIVSVVQRIPNLDHRIWEIEVVTPKKVMVNTGKPSGPLSGGGNVVTLEKKRGRWIVIGDWRETIWVS